MKFREHRGGLSESMETVVEVADHAGLLKHIRELARSWPTFPPVTADRVHIQPYGYDKRIGWNTHIVTLDGYGVLGFTDGPLMKLRLEPVALTEEDSGTFNWHCL